MKCPGVHCAGCGHGGGTAVLVVLAVVIAVLIRRPAEHAADVAGRIAVEVLEVAAIATASIAGLGVIGAGAYVALRLHRWHARNRQTIPSHIPIAQRFTGALSATRPAAIEAPCPALHVIRSEHPEEDPCSPSSSSS